MAVESAFKSRNLNYALNVEYFNDVFEKKPADANREIVKIAIGYGITYNEKIAPNGFTLQTCYPGLLAGIGNFHGGVEKESLNGGFSLDYVTGSPYIPASSVKGALRSAFEHEDYIKEMLKDTNVDVKKLVDEIFEGKKNGEEMPMYERDVFFDAFPVTKGRIMGIESITPHSDEFTSPTILNFMKVLPNVIFKFSFKLHEGIITAQQKEDLFKDIIKDFGMGAKTNVGFGAFEDVDKNKPFVENAAVKTVAGKEYPRRDKNSGANNDVIICIDCGKKYTLTNSEQENVRTKGYTYKRCKACQIANKAKRG